MSLSIIIPTLNEANHIQRLLDRLLASRNSMTEILVVDGGSEDATLELCQSYDEQVRVVNCGPRRSRQLNLGAQLASGDILYFVHADTLPPTSFMYDINDSLAKGFDLGAYRHRFEGGPFLLKLNAYLTRFNLLWLRGGDQSLFIKKDVFDQLGGFREDMVIMEDFDLIKRARKDFNYQVVPKDILISARKYDENHYLRVQFANLIAFNMFRYGMDSRRILNTYRFLLRYRS